MARELEKNKARASKRADGAPELAYMMEGILNYMGELEDLT
jgi:hypothetical protein